MNNPISYPLAAYMAGLVEGDGTILIAKDRKGRDRYVRVKFAFNSDDKPYAEFLRNKFNMGALYKSSNSNLVSWEIGESSDVLSLLSFMNGYLRTAKYETLRQAFEIYRIYHNIDVPLKPLNTSHILSDAWLSGFSDADSCFYVQIYKDKKYPDTLVITPSYKLQVANHYIIKKEEYSYLSDNSIFMEPLSRAFSVTLEKGTRKPIQGYSNETHSLTVRVYRKNNIPLLIEYFTKFPLFSSKYHNFLDLCEIIELKNNTKNQGCKLSTIEEKAYAIKNRMNTERESSTITWGHLDNFHPFFNYLNFNSNEL